MRKSAWLIIFAVSLVLFLVVSVFSTGKFGNSTEFKEKYAIFSLHMPDSLTFAGENVPLNYFDVKEGLDRELHVNTYFQSQTIFFIKRANRYFPEIEKILKEEGVPDDFKYLAVAESGLTNAISPANAVGLWQFLKSTSKEYGLEVNDEIDERYSIEKSTRAACRYLKDSYDLYKSWTLAAASYNMGRPGLTSQIEFQKANNYYDLFLNDETARYLFRIIAIKMIISCPDQYGFYIQPKDMYPPLKFAEVSVSASLDDLAGFALENKTNYKMLRLFNPWLRGKTLTNAKKATYIFRIPSDGFRESLYLTDLVADTIALHAN